MLKDFSKEKFDIVIQGGQSNSEGSGYGNAPQPYAPDGRVWVLDQNFAISTAQERVGGNRIYSDFSLEFARRYINDRRLREGRSLLIIRAAVGGTGFVDKRWGLADDLFLQMKEMVKTALALNPENRLVTFLWHQGENETGAPDYDTHYRNLSALVNTVRKEFAVSALPFIAGDFVELWKHENPGIWEPVIKAIRAVCGDTGNGAFVETGGLKSNFEECGPEPDGKDTIHFSRAALYELGGRYYDAYKNIV
jgi:hypothetical protein